MSFTLKFCNKHKKHYKVNPEGCSCNLDSHDKIIIKQISIENLSIDDKNLIQEKLIKIFKNHGWFSLRKDKTYNYITLEKRLVDIAKEISKK